MENQKVFEEGKAVFGVFRRIAEATEARESLRSNGYSHADISIVYPPRHPPRDFLQHQHRLIGVGALVGAAIGGVVFLVIGILISMRTIPVPALQQGSVIPDQMLMIGVILVGGIVFGAASGALVGIGTPQSVTKRYAEYVDSGGILMSVRVRSEDDATQAKFIFKKTGAQEIALLREDEGWSIIHKKTEKKAV